MAKKQSNGDVLVMDAPETAKRTPVTLTGPALVTFEIVGLSQLLMHNPAAMARPQGGGGKLGTKKIPTPEEEAEASVYRNANGELYLPSMQFRASMLKACTNRKIGKLAAKSIVAGSVFMVETECPLVHPDTGKPLTVWAIDSQRAVVQGNGIIRSRARLDRWATKLAMEIDPTFIPDPSLIEELLNIAGKICGVGDFRPNRGGPFGRFRATLKK
jgi:hypothetical protein